MPRLIFALILIAAEFTARAATPTIDSIAPAAVAPGTNPVVLNISGSNFAPSATVRFAGQSYTPQSITPHRVRVTIQSSALQSAGTVSVTVVNPAAAGTTNVSNTLPLPIVTAASSVSFTAPSRYGPPNPTFTTSGDFNNDGKLDLASLSTGTVSMVNILTGIGAGAFDSVTPPVIVCQNATALTTADFNGDGNLDIAVACVNSYLSILLGDGTGRFSVSTVATGQWGYALQIAAADFDGDGYPDLVVAGDTPVRVTAPVLLGDGHGNFTRMGSVPGLSANGIAIGDFNNDGVPDLAVARVNAAQALDIFIGDGHGNFSSNGPLSLIVGAWNVAVADFNNDGNLDLVASTQAGIAYVFLGDGTGHIMLVSEPSPPLSEQNVAVGDFNGDGSSDFALTGFGVLSIFLGDGNGSFFHATSSSYGGQIYNPVIGDFNNDGLADVAFGSQAVSAIDVVLQSPRVTTGSPYTIRDLCAPASCTLTVLGNSGVAAGLNSALYPGTPVLLNFPSLTGYQFQPYSINSAGLIAGAASSNSGSPTFAALWAPGNGLFLNLNSVFGWTQGIATSVNDLNQVVGYSDGIQPISYLNGTLTVNAIYELTNTGVLLGRDSRGSLAYTRQSGATYLTDPLQQPVALTRASFNNAGQVLLTAPNIGQLFTPDSGVEHQPPAPGFVVRAFNNRGQFIGLQTGSSNAPAIYTEAGGVVPLASLIPSPTAWNLMDVTAINDFGQILAIATNNARTTTVLLTPSGMGAHAIERHTNESRVCVSPSFNLTSVHTPGCASHEPVAR